MKPGQRAVFSRIATLVFLAVLLAGPGAAPVRAAGQINLYGPTGSHAFGWAVAVLPNGNFVVTDPYWDSPTAAYAGAVYLYDGATAALISTLTGSHANDYVGSYGVTVLANGHFVVHSPQWDQLRGAVTWCSATEGCSGSVSSGNSRVGSTANDEVGMYVAVLPGGAYVIYANEWDNPGVGVDAGAASWCSGAGPCTGPVSQANSLVGSAANDGVASYIVILSDGDYVVKSAQWSGGRGAATWCAGTGGCVPGVVSAANSLVGSAANDGVGHDITPLPNGAYVVTSPNWDAPGATNAGAATWCSGLGPCVGPPSSSNSLVGSAADDMVGAEGVTVLPSGNYVVQSPYWRAKGAATWCDGTTGCVGAVSEFTSVYGSYTSDQIGSQVTVLANGDYVVHSSYWYSNRGAARWCNGTHACSGPVWAENSLVGGSSGDYVGHRVAPLPGGDYVVLSPSWNEARGAATWCDGSVGRTGQVAAGNSLVGSEPWDWVGNAATVLANGHYVVQSDAWNNTMGAATWCDGTSGCEPGEVTVINSLVGTTSGDRVGLSVVALANGNYVVASPGWDNGSAADAGAATWCDGTSGCATPVSEANSLVGGSAGDKVGNAVTALTRGDYVVASPFWKSGGIATAGAVTWCSGATGRLGPLSAGISLVGERAGDQIGSGGVTALPNGHYVVESPDYDRDYSTRDNGAVTPAFGGRVQSGALSGANSVLAYAPYNGLYLTWAYDPVHHQFVVGRPADSTVTLFRWAGAYLPAIVRGD